MIARSRLSSQLNEFGIEGSTVFKQNKCDNIIDN